MGRRVTPVIVVATTLLATAFAFGVPDASAQSCSLCAREIVVSSQTAACLERALGDIGEGGEPFVVVDLASCLGSQEGTRGVVPTLSGPSRETVRLTTRFILERARLGCLRERFAARSDALDPYAVIALADCP